MLSEHLGVAAKVITFGHRDVDVDIYSIGYKLIKVRNCNGSIHSNHKTESINGGELIYIPCNCKFTLNLRPIRKLNIEVDVVDIEKKTYRELINKFTPLTMDKSIPLKTRELLINSKDIVNIFDSILYAYLTEVKNNPIITQSLVLNLIRELINIRITCPLVDGDRNTVDQVLDVLYLDIKKKWKLNEVACQLHMSDSKLQRKLKEENIEFSRLFNDFKLEIARKMLAHSKNSISNISFACGFDNITYFSSQFRRKYNMSPREFRKMLYT